MRDLEHDKGDRKTVYWAPSTYLNRSHEVFRLRLIGTLVTSQGAAVDTGAIFGLRLKAFFWVFESLFLGLPSTYRI